MPMLARAVTWQPACPDSPRAARAPGASHPMLMGRGGSAGAPGQAPARLLAPIRPQAGGSAVAACLWAPQPGVLSAYGPRASQGPMLVGLGLMPAIPGAPGQAACLWGPRSGGRPRVPCLPGPPRRSLCFWAEGLPGSHACGGGPYPMLMARGALRQLAPRRPGPGRGAGLLPWAGALWAMLVGNPKNPGRLLSGRGVPCLRAS